MPEPGPMTPRTRRLIFLTTTSTKGRHISARENRTGIAKASSCLRGGCAHVMLGVRINGGALEICIHGIVASTSAWDCRKNNFQNRYSAVRWGEWQPYILPGFGHVSLVRCVLYGSCTHILTFSAVAAITAKWSRHVFSRSGHNATM